jgi:hypothetical protein
MCKPHDKCADAGADAKANEGSDDGVVHWRLLSSHAGRPLKRADQEPSRMKYRLRSYIDRARILFPAIFAGAPAAADMAAPHQSFNPP